MELYNLYYIATTFFSMLGASIPSVFYYGLAIGGGIWLALFILQGVGLYAMAKRQGVNGKWRAFVPFASTLLIGKLAGECRVFNQKVKRAGLYTMIAQIITTVFCVALVAAQIYLYVVEGAPKFTEWDTPYWTNLQGFSNVVFRFYDISAYILSIIQFVYEVLMLILLLGLYKKYYPKNYMLFAFLALFVPLSRYIVIFALRNRTPVDYDAYMRARYEAYMRQRGQYGQYGGYGNPYANPYAGQTPTSTQPPEEPFGEFTSEGRKNTDESSEEATDDPDDFFS